MLHYSLFSLVNFNSVPLLFLLLNQLIGRITNPKSLNFPSSIFPLQFFAFFIFLLILICNLFNLNNIIWADLFEFYRFNRRHIALTNLSNFVNLIKLLMLLSLLTTIYWSLSLALVLSTYLLVRDKQFILLFFITQQII